MLKHILSEKKPSILKRWFEHIIETYPTDSRQFLKRTRDGMSNPVGTTVSEALEPVFEGILYGSSSAELAPHLDRIIRIRAVQEFSASEAVGFVFPLKQVVREELKARLDEPGVSEGLAEFDANVDNAILAAFDVYMQCREKLYEIRANDIKNRTFAVLEKRGLISRDFEDREQDGLMVLKKEEER